MFCKLLLEKSNLLHSSFFSVILQNHTEVHTLNEQKMFKKLQKIVFKLFKEGFWQKPIYGKITNTNLQ